MLYSWMNFQKLLDQNPETDFFRVGTSFMCVDQDLWQLQLFLPNTTVTKCNTLVRFFKSCYQNPETDFFRVGTSFLCVDFAVHFVKTLFQCHICDYCCFQVDIKTHQKQTWKRKPSWFFWNHTLAVHFCKEAAPMWYLWLLLFSSCY